VLKAGRGGSSLGHFAVRSSRRCIDVVSATTVLDAWPISWRWIAVSFEACRLLTVLAVCLGSAAGSVIVVDISAAQASFLGLRLVSLWSRWSSSSAERQWWFSERVDDVSVAGLGGGGAIHSSPSACAQGRVVLHVDVIEFIDLGLCLVHLCRSSA
jgi:hypothetical protein